jgi:hypothetical protein
VLVRTHIQLDSLRRYALCVHWFFDASFHSILTHRRQSFRGFAPQDIELVSKNEDFGFQRSPRPEQPDQGAPDQSAKIAHRSDYQPIRGRQSAVLGLR